MLPFLVDDPTQTVVLVPLGSVKAREIAAVRRALVRTYNLEFVVGPRRPLPKETYYPPRRRYRADHLVAWLAKDGPGDKVLGIASVDISTTTRGHKDWGISGLGQLGGRSAVVSSFRSLHSLDRLGEVAIHEIGHTLGLPHCPHVGCTMQDAKGKLSRIGERLCPSCRAKIARYLR